LAKALHLSGSYDKIIIRLEQRKTLLPHLNVPAVNTLLSYCVNIGSLLRIDPTADGRWSNLHGFSLNGSL